MKTPHTKPRKSTADACADAPNYHMVRPCPADTTSLIIKGKYLGAVHPKEANALKITPKGEIIPIKIGEDLESECEGVIDAGLGFYIPPTRNFHFIHREACAPHAYANYSRCIVAAEWDSQCGFEPNEHASTITGIPDLRGTVLILPMEFLMIPRARDLVRDSGPFYFDDLVEVGGERK